MNAEVKPEFATIDQAANYVDTVREHYREGHGEYRGRRTPEQQLIAEVTSDEAHLLLDGVFQGILSLSGVVYEPVQDAMLQKKQSEPLKAGFSWNDYRGEFERLLVGFAVLSSRLERDGYKVKSYADLRAEDRIKVASSLLSDFMHHNTLRFGVEGSGVKKTEFKTRYTDEGDVERIRITTDKDKAKSEREIEENMMTRKYSSGIAAHPAAKMSPKEYVELRREYPEVDKDMFDQIVSAYIDARSTLEKRE